MLDEFIKAANVPKLASNGYQPLVPMIKRLINDSNFNVVLSAIKLTCALAKGLRKNFTSSAKNLSTPILQKFKEKKTLLLEEIHNCMEQFFYCITPEDIIEDLKEALNDKNPVFKINILTWVDKYIEKKNPPLKGVQSLGKALTSTFKKLIDDGQAEVRDAILNTIGKFKATIGDSFIQDFKNINP